MDQIALQRIIQLPTQDDLPVQQRPLAPPHLPAPLLIDQQPASQLVLADLEERRQLVEVHGRVQLQVALDRGREHGAADLVHEDGGVVVHGVDVEGRGGEVGRRRGDELGARGAEEFLEQGEGVGRAALEAREGIAVLLAQRGVDGVVEFGGVQGDADGDKGVHLVVFLADGVEPPLGAVFVLLEVLGARDVDEDVGEHADGVGVAPHHHVAEADVVVGREVGGHDAGEHGFFVQLDVIERLEREGEVAQQAVHAQQADDAEVAEHAVEGPGAVFAGDGVRVGVLAHGGELGSDFGALDERVEDVEDGVAAPGVGVVAEEGEVIVAGGVCGGGGIAGEAVTVAAEGFELVDEFVDDVPGPEGLFIVSVGGPVVNGVRGDKSYRRWFQIDWTFRIQDVVE